MQLYQLKHGTNIYVDRAFSRKLKEFPRGYTSSLICMEEGKILGKYLIKMPPGKTTNEIAHLKTCKKFLEAQGKAESEATKHKMKGNDEDHESGKKLKSTQLSSFFPKT